MAKQARPPRKDPKPVETNVFDQSRIDPDTKDPTRFYEFVSLRSMNMGVQQREALGWAIERTREDGPKLIIGATSKPNEPIALQDTILMSVDKERYERARYEGWYGGAGQKYYDDMDSIIQRRRTGAMQNMPRVSGVSLQNKTDQVQDLGTWE